MNLFFFLLEYYTQSIANIPFLFCFIFQWKPCLGFSNIKRIHQMIQREKQLRNHFLKKSPVKNFQNETDFFFFIFEQDEKRGSHKDGKDRFDPRWDVKKKSKIKNKIMCSSPTTRKSFISQRHKYSIQVNSLN